MPKILDYHCSSYPDKLAETIERIPSLINSQEFSFELRNMLDRKTFDATISNPSFLKDMQERLLSIHSKVLDLVKPSTPAKLEDYIHHHEKDGQNHTDKELDRQDLSSREER